MTPEQAGWAILAAVVIFGGELLVWVQGHLDRCRRGFVRAVRSELRSRADAVRGGSEEEAGGRLPRSLPAPAGGEQRTPGPVSVALPPAPSTSQRPPTNSQSGSSRRLAGAVTPDPASARPPRVRIGGAW